VTHGRDANNDVGRHRAAMPHRLVARAAG
jgi:hypothetical protein